MNLILQAQMPGFYFPDLEIGLRVQVLQVEVIQEEAQEALGWIITLLLCGLIETYNSMATEVLLVWPIRRVGTISWKTIPHQHQL